MGKKRVSLETKDENINSYFTSNKKNLKFVSTGCTVLDCSIGGGGVLGRMLNIVGDKSTAKTALATELLINFLQKYKGCRAAYRETEGAYDMDYAEAMGAPIDDIDFGDLDNPIDTVERFYKDLEAFIKERTEAGEPGVYILDSFDALSDEAEKKRDIDEGSYHMAKQKQIGILFRKLTKKIENSKVLLVIISQLRENIGVSFGEKYRRSGGKALDFYASQIVWLAHTGILYKTRKKVKRAYGISVKARCKKNKVGLAFREAEFDFIFGYGVDDIAASLTWLKSVGKLEEAGIDVKEKDLKKYIDSLDNLTDKEYGKLRSKISKTVKRIWNEIETDFIPKRKKYRGH